jgi:hypothetical protein
MQAGSNSVAVRRRKNKRFQLETVYTARDSRIDFSAGLKAGDGMKSLESLGCLKPIFF